MPLLEDWPPAGATAVDVADLYARLSARGLEYGPAFQGLTGAWRLGNVVYGQVALPAGAADGAGITASTRRSLMRRCMCLRLRKGLRREDAEGVLLPFAWSDVTLHARGAGELRVRIELSPSGAASEGRGGGVRFAGDVRWDGAAGRDGGRSDAAPRDGGAGAGGGAVGASGLYRVSWQAVPLAPVGGGAREVGGGGRNGRIGGGAWALGTLPMLPPCGARLDAGEAGARASDRRRRRGGAGAATGGSCVLPRALQSETARALGEVQALLSEARLAPTALVWVTCSAISTGADDGVDDLVHAPLWGLLRSTRTEHSDRVLRLLDVEGEEPSGEQLWPLLAADGEPELAWRNRRAWRRGFRQWRSGRRRCRRRAACAAARDGADHGRDGRARSGVGAALGCAARRAASGADVAARHRGAGRRGAGGVAAGLWARRR